MINFKTSGKKIAALTLTTLIMSSCSAQIGTNTSPDKAQEIKTKLTPEAENIEKMKAAYENYLKEQEQKLQEPASYNVLTPADFEVGGFESKANLTLPEQGVGQAAVYIKIGTTFYTLTYEFMRKLRIALNPDTAPPPPPALPKIQNYLTIAEYNALNNTGTAGTVTDVNGNTSSYKPTSSEAAFLSLLKTMDAVRMPNFLQGFNGDPLETNDDDAEIAVNPDQEPSGYDLVTEELAFISNAKSTPVRLEFYEEIWDATGAGDYILDNAEYNFIKTNKLPSKPGSATLTVPNSTELAFLNGINAQVTAWGVYLIDNDSVDPDPPDFEVQAPIDIEVGYGNNQSPGGFGSGTQTALNIIQNTGMVNRNEAARTDNDDLVVQEDEISNVLTPLKHQAGTNYAPSAVVIAAEQLLQGADTGAAINNDNPDSTAFFNGQYGDFVTVPALGDPITFNNFHSIMRTLQEDYMDDVPDNYSTSSTAKAAYDKKSKGGLKFAFTSSTVVSTTDGLGAALDSGWVGFAQTVLAKGSTSSTQNKTAITSFLGDPANLNLTTGRGHIRGIVAQCTRATTGALTFSSATTTNHAILVKYEIIPGVGNVLFVYDPGMPNNPLAPIPGISNYRPVTDTEKTALYASPVKLVGIERN